MKRYVVSLSITLTILFLTHACIAQEQHRNVLGVGMSIEPGLFGSTLIYYTTAYGPEGYYALNQSAYATSPINVYIPINATPSFRIEPVFGLYSFKSERTAKTPGYTPSITMNKTEVTLTHLGLGGFYLIPTSNSLQMYVGPRFGINFITILSAGSYTIGGVLQETESKETDFAAGLSFGAEYSPMTEFSIGAEVAANFVSFGNPEIARTPPQTSASTTDRDQHVITTNALFFLRWYFVGGGDAE